MLNPQNNLDRSNLLDHHCHRQGNYCKSQLERNKEPRRL